MSSKKREYARYNKGKTAIQRMKRAKSDITIKINKNLLLAVVLELYIILLCYFIKHNNL